jgi:hypothetical protein
VAKQASKVHNKLTSQISWLQQLLLMPVDAHDVLSPCPSLLAVLTRDA